MRKFIILSLALSFASLSAFATEDLTIPGERWASKFDKFICAAFQPGIARPAAFEKYNVVFTGVTSDKTLDNGVLKATFEENGKACRYSAILLADNAAATIGLVESRAFVPEASAEAADCAEGKALLDAALADNSYLYYGHPHNLAIMMPLEGAEEACGPGAQAVGVNFVVTGLIKP